MLRLRGHDVSRTFNARNEAKAKRVGYPAGIDFGAKTLKPDWPIVFAFVSIFCLTALSAIASPERKIFGVFLVGAWVALDIGIASEVGERAGRDHSFGERGSPGSRPKRRP